VDLLPDRLEVARRLREGVALTVEEEEVLGAVRLGGQEVVERQPQLVREMADLGVSLVDELPAVLGDLAVGEGAADRPAATAHAVGGLMHLGDVPGLLKAVGARQSREAGSHDDDTRRGRRAGYGDPAYHRAQSRRRPGGPGALEQFAPRGACRMRGRALDLLHQRSASHPDERMRDEEAPAMAASAQPRPGCGPLSPHPLCARGARP
jgi:hypothetical protein